MLLLELSFSPLSMLYSRPVVGYDGGGGSGGGGGSCRCWTGSAHQLVCMFCACPVVMVVGVRVMVAF